MDRFLTCKTREKQIFSNGNEAHVAKVLCRLGLEDCFDDIICFETLNPTHKGQEVPEKDSDGEFISSLQKLEQCNSMNCMSDNLFYDLCFCRFFREAKNSNCLQTVRKCL